MFLGQPERVRVALAARCNVPLEHHRSADDVNDSKRVQIAMRVDTDDVIQLICKHP